MTYRMIEHTADLRFEVAAGSCGELFVEALRAMTAWTDPSWCETAVERRFSIESADRAMLLVDLLNEALALSQIHREAYDDIEFLVLSDRMAEGRFTGRKISGARDEVKAVTYHGATVVRTPEGTWSADILMDI